jgi:hypothetical protein
VNGPSLHYSPSMLAWRYECGITFPKCFLSFSTCHK